MIRLRISAEAEEELAAAAEWYEAQRFGLGIELVAAVQRALDRIVAAPFTSATWRGDREYRTRVLRGSPT